MNIDPWTLAKMSLCEINYLTDKEKHLENAIDFVFFGLLFGEHNMGEGAQALA